jgi:Fe2+ transport system protein B
VVPLAARYREGLEVLLPTLNDVATGAITCRGYRIANEPPDLKRAVGELVAQLEQAFPGLPNARWIALRLLDGDERMIEAVRTRELDSVVSQAQGAPPPLEPAASLV